MPRATKPIQIIYSDLEGPYSMTREGYRYYITFLDDYSGCTWIYLLKNKSDAFEAFKRFKAPVEKQAKQAGTNSEIVFLRTDRGGEYIDAEFQAYLKDCGIKWEPSAAYTSHQNGKAERVNYTIMSMMRSMRAYAKLPPTFWAFLVIVAVYLLNRSPRESKPSPFEILNGKAPNLSHLKIIGSRA